MGGGSWTSTDWSSYSSAHIAGKSASAIFTARSIKEENDPAKFKMRESRDSVGKDASTPIILAADVTGSMHMIAHTLIKNGINMLATEIYDRKPVTDPHIMVLAVGDSETDDAPIQATQFEADIALAPQVTSLWVEGGGGGNQGESYSMAHLLAGLKTSTDSYEKRGKKGYLFTIGDEPILPITRKEDIKKFLGLDFERDLTARECLDIAQRSYEVFHVVIGEGYARHGAAKVKSTWDPLLPQRVLWLDDHTKLAEVVVSAIQVFEGASKAHVASSWKGSTAVSVATAIAAMAAHNGAGKGARRL